MREILFRGKRTDVDAWAYGYLNKHPSAIQVGEGSPYYIEIPPQDPDDDGGRYNVHRGTVGQFMGILDKHGNKIFEGDIIQTQTIDRRTRKIIKYNFLIKYGEYSPNEFCQFKYKDFRAFGLFATDGKKDFQMSNYSNLFEIIGNIYDNPELLATEG